MPDHRLPFTVRDTFAEQRLILSSAANSDLLTDQGASMAVTPKPIVSIAAMVNNTPTSFALDDIEIISDHANETLLTVREQMLLPHPKKHPPVFTTPQLAALCRIDRKKVNYYWERPELALPQGPVCRALVNSL